jgi:integrase
VGRPRKHDKHLPANMIRRHGAYYFVSGGKWLRLSKDYGAALTQYATFVGTPAVIETIKDAVWDYIEFRRGKLAAATLVNYRYSAANLCAVFGAHLLKDITPAMVYRFISDAGTVQANRDKALLSAAFTHARNRGAFSGIDPTKGLQYRNEEKPRDRYVTNDELTKLLATASPKLACIARFIELTGMRQGDALRVRLADLNEEGIAYQQGKTGRRLVVLWSAELTGVVDDAKRLWRRFGREYLFESSPKGRHAKRGPGPYTPSGLRALWRVARDKAGLSDVNLHDLRRKAGSDSGSDEEAQALMGHADGKVTKKHYRAKPSRVNPLR